MSKIDRNIDAYDRLMLRTSQLRECQEELTALRAWKEQRLKEETRSYFKTLEENGQLGALIDELNKLRAWKAKARPFLPLAQCKILDSMMRARVDGENVYLDALQENLNELTELLGGSDEN